MHYDRESFSVAAKQGPEALKPAPEVRCVAGCYRCLLSYFNQPDHELIDRRLSPVLLFLLRLAYADVTDIANLHAAAHDLDNCPPHDSEPLEIDQFSIKWIWRSSRVAAVDDASAPTDLGDSLASKGIDLIRLPSNAEERTAAVAQLASVLDGKRA